MLGLSAPVLEPLRRTPGPYYFYIKFVHLFFVMAPLIEEEMTSVDSCRMDASGCRAAIPGASEAA